MGPEEWVQIIDGLFTTSTYKNRSLKNTANRSKQLYGSYHGTQSYAQRRYDEVKEGGAPQHVEGWRDMHFKGSSGWYNQLAEQHWENISDELNKAKSTSDGDDTPVDEVEVLQRSLGERRGHVWGVGRKVKSITPNLPPHMYHLAANELQQQLVDANARWAEQQRINEMMQQQINKMQLAGSCCLVMCRCCLVVDGVAAAVLSDRPSGGELLVLLEMVHRECQEGEEGKSGARAGLVVLSWEKQETLDASAERIEEKED
ncbi:hypothetical protein E3N88_32038 [Mikania micrantha]|uniref:Uncharacterized protein n=1 Tax=Mikania micrantha TaxID=192012 RepID=A0A5N6M7B7_9ASTR|nr:hypothetical protein E3N88_32038 [Mikania micrantha]